jgi:putative membrane protein
MIVFGVIASLFHLLAFVLESLLFMRPKVHKRFGAGTTEEAQAVKLMAFNQGFYNLFLVIGCVTGMLLWQSGNAATGIPLLLFTCASMAGAGVVLAFSAPGKLRVALYQAVPPAIVLVAYFF